MDFLGRFAVPHPSAAIYGSMVAIALVSIAIVVGLTYFKKWGYLWREWITTVDHKRIGIMYIASALIMFVRGLVDALMLRMQLAVPDNKLLDSQHYNEVFSTHGIIMIIFMAMPFLFGLMNIATPLQIGARDVAFPRLNAVSFWLFFMGAMLLNISFVVGGSPDAGWTSYFPLAGNEFSPSVGTNYYMLSIQLSGMGSLITAINFLTTIFRMRAPGMKLMQMPMFTWSILVTNVLILAVFPVFAMALVFGTMDRLFGTQFYTIGNGGMDMMWANLFWIWGHPEVYIVILPAFGIYSEIIATFARRNLFGYKAMVGSMVAITILSVIVWVHHFYTMGQGVLTNSIFSITTMAIAVPTGVKIFNWLFTLRKGSIVFATPMLWTLAFIPTFTIGGVTGVMLAMASADFQYHNTMFLVAHFHYTLIPGVVYAFIAGMIYWWPKFFGFMLNEKIGKVSFWMVAICFNITFFPMFITGLDGQARRMFTYSAETGFGPLNLVSSIGAVGLVLGFVVLVYNIYWSTRYMPRNVGEDPWNARSLEWATASPIPEYNFATLAHVNSSEALWDYKKKGHNLFPDKLEEIHMPNNSGMPFIMSVLFFIGAFGLIFSMIPLAIVALIGIFVCMALRSFEQDHGHHISVKEIEETEKRLRGAKG